MSSRGKRRSLREATIAAMLPSPGGGLPGLDELDLQGFWRRFDEKAPVQLKVAFALAAFLVGSLLPRLLRYGGSLPSLNAEAREAVILRAARIRIAAPLITVVKVVASLAYFSDPSVEARVRLGR